MQALANFGFDEFRHSKMREATNAKMSEIASAATLAMLDRLDQHVSRRQASLRTLITSWPDSVTFQTGVGRSTLQFVSVALHPAVDRSAFQLALAGAGVESRTYFEPLHQHPAFAHSLTIGDLGTTRDLAGRIVSLPMYSDMTDQEAAYLGRAVSEALELVRSEDGNG